MEVKGKIFHLNMQGETLSLSGVPVTLYDAKGKPQLRITNAEGHYSFPSGTSLPTRLVFPRYHFRSPAEQPLEVLELTSAAEIELSKVSDLKPFLSHYSPHPAGQLAARFDQTIKVLSGIKELLAEGSTGHLAAVVAQLITQTETLDKLSTSVAALATGMETSNTRLEKIGTQFDTTLKAFDNGVEVREKLVKPDSIKDKVAALLEEHQKQWEQAAGILDEADENIFGTDGVQAGRDPILAELRQQLQAAQEVARLRQVWLSKKQGELAGLSDEVVPDLQTDARQRQGRSITEVIGKITGLRLAVLSLQFSPRLKPGEFSRYEPIAGQLDRVRQALASSFPAPHDT